jgi:hypothetical protein
MLMASKVTLDICSRYILAIYNVSFIELACLVDLRSISQELLLAIAEKLINLYNLRALKWVLEFSSQSSCRAR